MAEHREYRVLRSGGRGGREPGILVAGTRDRDTVDRMVDAFAPVSGEVEVWVETRTVTDWARLECPERPEPVLEPNIGHTLGCAEYRKAAAHHDACICKDVPEPEPWQDPDWEAMARPTWRDRVRDNTWWRG